MSNLDPKALEAARRTASECLGSAEYTTTVHDALPTIITAYLSALPVLDGELTQENERQSSELIVWAGIMSTIVGILLAILVGEVLITY